MIPTQTRRPRTSEPFTLVVERAARKELTSLPPKISRQVETAIQRLLETLDRGERPQDMRRIVTRPGVFRIDSGEYRILFEMNLDDRVVTIVRVANRKNAYWDM